MVSKLYSFFFWSTCTAVCLCVLGVTNTPHHTLHITLAVEYGFLQGQESCTELMGRKKMTDLSKSPKKGAHNCMCVKNVATLGCPSFAGDLLRLHEQFITGARRSILRLLLCEPGFLPTSCETARDRRNMYMGSGYVFHKNEEEKKDKRVKSMAVIALISSRLDCCELVFLIFDMCSVHVPLSMHVLSIFQSQTY